MPLSQDPAQAKDMAALQELQLALDSQTPLPLWAAGAVHGDGDLEWRALRPGKQAVARNGDAFLASGNVSSQGTWC